MAVLLTAQIAVFDRPRKRPEYVPSESDRRVESMARVAVERSLEVIGHGVRVSRVTVEPVYWWAAATYCYDTQAICFANDQLFSADEMLQIAAHETVHAIFDQAGLNPWSGSPAHDSRALVEEVAAAVLGAHIAGRVRALGGVDGSDLTRRMIAEYRYHCDVNAPGSLRRKIWARSLRLSYDIRFPRDLADAVAIHYGPLEMIDTMDRICRDNPDPWVAAHLIAERFMEPIPEPVEVPPFQGTAAQ